LKQIRTIGIVGAGATGQGIAYLAAAAGYRTVLEDVSSARLVESRIWIAEAFDRAIARGRRTPEQKITALANVVTARSVEDVCREADLLIDATAEEMEVKLEIFTLFDRFAKPGTILASSTASVSIADLAGITFCAENCVGMRFAAPVGEAGRIEIVRAPATSEATVAACAEVGRRMGREVVVVHDPGEPAAGAGR
jgi:3-hydroxyacyl-CoA dehydrogenase